MKTTVLKPGLPGLVGLGLVLMLNLFNSQGSLAAGSYPNSMAATGDSITRAFNSDQNNPLSDIPGYSWSTGTDVTVNSHYSRILAANPAISGANYNDGNSEPAHTVWVVGSNQTFSTSLSNSQAGDTIAFASSTSQSLNSATVIVPAKIKVVGAGCGASASTTINYTGGNSSSSFSLGGGDTLYGINLKGFHLVANTTNGNGANRLSCVVVNATRISE